MKKTLSSEIYERVKVLADRPVGPLYGAHGCKVGEVPFQMEASDPPKLGTVSAACHLVCAASADQGRLDDEAINLVRQYVGLDENGNLRMRLKEAKDFCDGLKAEMNRTVANEWSA